MNSVNTVKKSNDPILMFIIIPFLIFLESANIMIHKKGINNEMKNPTFSCLTAKYLIIFD